MATSDTHTIGKRNAEKLKARFKAKHTWCEKTDSLRTHYWPAAFPGAKSWHREGSLDEIEQRENAGQRSFFG